jgi:Ca-activated chloride channel family protein
VSFLEPLRLWLLLILPVLVLAYLWLQRRRRHYAVRFTNLALLDRVAPRRVNWRQHAAVVLALLTLGLALVLFAKPTDVVKVPRRTGVTVVLTMDVSLSMAAADVNPDRITAAKQTAKEFLSQLPPAFKVAVVSFARYATVVLPPTVDRQRVNAAINSLQLAEYTATGEGIYTALDVVKQSLGTTERSGGKLPAMIVLISDGARTVGRSQVSAATAAKAQGVPIYTVALGTAAGIIINGGQTVAVPVEIGELEQVARISGGRSYIATSPRDLVHAYQDVDGRLVYTTQRRDATSEYMGYLVVMSMISTGAGLFVASRWP